MPLSVKKREEVRMKRSLKERSVSQRAEIAPSYKMNGQQMEEINLMPLSVLKKVEVRMKRERGQRAESVPISKMNGQQMEEIISCHCLFKKIE